MAGLVNTSLHIRFRAFVIKATLAVEACVEHAATAQDSNEHCEGLEGREVLHVSGNHTTEEDAGGANERGHLGN